MEAGGTAALPLHRPPALFAPLTAGPAPLRMRGGGGGTCASPGSAMVPRHAPRGGRRLRGGGKAGAARGRACAVPRGGRGGRARSGVRVCCCCPSPKAAPRSPQPPRSCPPPCPALRSRRNTTTTTTRRLRGRTPSRGSTVSAGTCGNERKWGGG